jgi:hypothetical protein
MRQRVVVLLRALLLCTPVLVSGFCWAEPKLYRWVDERGVVHYTDHIPASEAERGRTELNAQGIAVDTVAPAKSVQELRRERELERLREQQEQLLAKQREEDQILLRTFRSVDDLIMAREGKLAAIDVVIGVARTNIRSQQKWLSDLRREAADLERSGKPVPDHLQASIAKTERYIRDAYASIVEREQQKDGIRLDFDRSLLRFRQLRNIPVEPGDSLAAPKRPMLGNLVTCSGRGDCERLWAKGLAYVEAHATTPVQTSGPNIHMTAPPQTPEDLSLTLSLIGEPGAENASLFLDMQCKSVGTADSRCADERAGRILEGFRSALSGGGEGLPGRGTAAR